MPFSAPANNKYVLIYARPVGYNSNDILIVLKNRPKWQAGKFNLPGGKIEEGEDPIQAAVRELDEEAGLSTVAESTIMGRVFGDWGELHCVKCPVFDNKLNPRPEETEVISWMNWSEIKNHHLLLPNLRVIAPMMMAGVEGWVIRDEGFNTGKLLHNIEITIKGTMNG